MHYSPDEGVSWALQHTYEAPFEGRIQDLVAPGGRVVIARFYDDPSRSFSVTRSADNGKTWTEVDELAADSPIGFYASAKGDLYTFTSRGALLLRSTDLGKTWRSIRPVSSPQGAIEQLTSTPDGTLVASFYDSITRLITYHRYNRWRDEVGAL